jgi:hypothetical protein
MHKNATKCNETLRKWCKNKHGASKIIDTFETYQCFEKMSAFEIITDLKAVFAPQARAERYEASELFFFTRMNKHNSVSEHVVKMSGYVQCMNALDCQIPNDLAIDRVLQSLPPSYKGFILNYNM